MEVEKLPSTQRLAVLYIVYGSSGVEISLLLTAPKEACSLVLRLQPERTAIRDSGSLPS